MLLKAGTVFIYNAGAFPVRPWDPIEHFTYVVDGEDKVVNAYTDKRHLDSSLGPNQIMGEISFLSGGGWSMAVRAFRDT